MKLQVAIRLIVFVAGVTIITGFREIAVVEETVFREGRIVEKITVQGNKISSDQASDSTMEMTITRHFKGNRTREFVQMPGGYTITITDRDKNQKLILANVNDQKKYALVDIEEDENKRDLKLKVKTLDSTAKFLDFPCLKYSVKFMGIKGVVYTTRQIDVVSYHTQFSDQIQGYPMFALFKVDMFGVHMKMKFQTVQVENTKVPEIKFSFNVPDGFEESTQKEIREMFRDQ